MIYILMIWTVVGYTGISHMQATTRVDWRPLGEFHNEDGRIGLRTAQQMCEEAARQLGLTSEKYRCIRSK